MAKSPAEIAEYQGSVEDLATNSLEDSSYNLQQEVEFIAAQGGGLFMPVMDPFLSNDGNTGIAAQIEFDRNGDPSAITFHEDGAPIVEMAVAGIDDTLADFGNLDRETQLGALATSIETGQTGATAEYLMQMAQAGRPLTEADKQKLQSLGGDLNYSFDGNTFKSGGFSMDVNGDPEALKALDSAWKWDTGWNTGRDEPKIDHILRAIKLAGSFEDAQGLLENTFNPAMSARGADWEVHLVRNRADQAVVQIMKRNADGVFEAFKPDILAE